MKLDTSDLLIESRLIVTGASLAGNRRTSDFSIAPVSIPIP